MVSDPSIVVEKLGKSHDKEDFDCVFDFSQFN